VAEARDIGGPIAAEATPAGPSAQAGSAEWHVVLTRDGTVVAALDGAPASWVGARLADWPDAPDDARQAAAALLASASELPLEATVRLDSVQRIVRFAVVEAVPVRRARTDIRALLGSSLKALRQQAADRDVALDITVDDQVPPLLNLDPDKVAWLTSALVGNALRYVRQGTRVMPGGWIAVSVTYTERVLTIEVRDDGPGIPPENLPRLFASGSDRARVGLGLLMVRDLVAAHGGWIEVGSDPSVFAQGTTVRLTLPVAEGRAHRPSSPDSI
jgi:signal transduction histidine kinase